MYNHSFVLWDQFLLSLFLYWSWTGRCVLRSSLVPLCPITCRLGLLLNARFLFYWWQGWDSVVECALVSAWVDPHSTAADIFRPIWWTIVVVASPKGWAFTLDPRARSWRFSFQLQVLRVWLSARHFLVQIDVGRCSKCCFSFPRRRLTQCDRTAIPLAGQTSTSEGAML